MPIMDKMLRLNRMNRAATAVASAAFTFLLAFIGYGAHVDTAMGYLTDSAESQSSITIAAIEKKAFAVYSADDSSFCFYKRAEVPNAGDVFEGKTVTSIWTDIETKRYGYSSPWPSASKTISVTVVDEISPIDCSHWFSGMSVCTAMDLAKLDTSNVLEMDRMFYTCKSIQELDLSNFDTSNVTTMSEMFYGDTALESIAGTFNWDVSSVVDMWRMFNKCGSIEMLDVSTWNTASCTRMESMFADCTALKALDTSNFDMSNITSLFCMFDTCKKLEAINGISSWDTSACTNMYGAFRYCQALTSLDISHWDVSSVTSMDSMLNWCSSLKEIDLSSLDTRSLVSSSSIFNGMIKLQRISIGEQWPIPLATCSLPMPSSAYIAGADGKWYDEATGQAYADRETIPIGVAAIYVALPPDITKTSNADTGLGDIAEDMLGKDAAIDETSGVYDSEEADESSSGDTHDQEGASEPEEEASEDAPTYGADEPASPVSPVEPEKNPSQDLAEGGDCEDALAVSTNDFARSSASPPVSFL